MQSVLNHYLQQDKLGLLLLDMPTGSGKTYSILEYIATHIDSLRVRNQKIIFITSLKKNLPLEELKLRLREHEKSEYFDEEVLIVQSAEDAFKTYFEQYESHIKKLFPNYDCFSVKEAIKGLESLAIKSDLRQIVNRQSNELRGLIADALQEKYPKSEDKINAIKNDPKWQWISKLFPAALTTDRSVIFMSVSKFIYPYQTIIQPSMPFSDLLKEFYTTLFIDEFDSSKQVIQNYIIQQGLKNNLELVPTVRQIASRLQESHFPGVLLPDHVLTKQPATPSEIEASFREKSQQLIKEFNTGLSLKSRTDVSHQSFIFYDKDTHYLADANNKVMTIEVDHNQNTLWIDFDKKDKNEKDKKTTLGQLLGKHRKFTEWFKGGLSMLANNYYHQRRNEVGISFEDAVRSYLDFFHLPESSVKQLVNEIQYKRLSKISLPSDSSDDEQLPSSEFYHHGFAYHAISNGENHAGRSKVLSFNFPCAAELILLNWCRKFMVVGISATANINSRLGNYDLHYLKFCLEQDSKEKIKYHSLSRGQKQALEQQFYNSKSGYDQVEILTHWHGMPSIAYESNAEQYFSSLFGVGKENGATKDDITSLFNEIKNLHNDESYLYHLTQYYKIFELWCAHLSQNTVAFLLLFGKGYREKEIELIREFCQLLSDYHQKLDRDAKEEIISIVGNDSTKVLGQVQLDLAQGKRRFVLSTYATLGAGINIQFPIPDNYPRELVKINPFIADTHTDFDALYLDNPTNILVNTNGNQRILIEDLVKHIYQLEYLKISGLTPGDFHSYLQKAFLAYIGRPNRWVSKKENIYHSNDYRLHVMQILIQAIGRICRTNMKSPIIHLHLDQKIANNWYDNLGDMPLLPELHQISQAVAQDQQSQNILFDAVKSKDMIKVRNAIYHMLSKFKGGCADYTVISQWHLIRDICLRYPQYNEQLGSQYRFFYTNFDCAKSAYYYHQENDYQTVEILSDKQAYAYEVSEISAKLHQLMQHCGLKKYFISQGYATSLPASRYWLQPILFNNIYKGALGEKCGAYLWESYELPPLEQMPEKFFEQFDYKINDDVFVDFKYWSATHYYDEQMQNDIFDKMQCVDAKLLFIINILSDDNYLDYKVICGDDNNTGRQIVEIPAFMLQGSKLIEVVSLIKKKISEYDV